VNKLKQLSEEQQKRDIQFQMDLKQREAAHQKTCSDLQQHFSSNINRLSDESRARDERYKLEVTALEGHFTLFISEMQVKYKVSLEETETKYSLFISDLQARHKATLEQTEAKYEAFIAERN